MRSRGERETGWTRSLLTLSHPVLQITERAMGTDQKITSIGKIQLRMHVGMYINRAQVPIRFPASSSSSKSVSQLVASRASHVDPPCVCRRLGVANQSVHSKCAGVSANHSSLVRDRAPPSISQRIFGRYGFLFPSVPWANMRVLTDL